MQGSSSRPKQPAKQYQLLLQRRFSPYFFTQALGAFNDNLYKNALVTLFAFVSVTHVSFNVNVLINLAAGLFILPFFLFSATCGQLADKYEKSLLIRRIKLLEIAIMALASIGLLLSSISIMLIALFLMGVQSTLFGPVKYSYLPQHLSESELTGGNALVELGTFLAILSGTIIGTQLISESDGQLWPMIILILSTSCISYWVSRSIPATSANDPAIRIKFNPYRETLALLQDVARNRVVMQCILAISWFWLLGATYLAQLPVFTKTDLGGNIDVLTLLLAGFSIGIGVGSLFCERLSHGTVEIGLVPVGAIGITVFGLDLVAASNQYTPGLTASLGDFLSQSGSLRMVIDLVLIGVFGGLYIVPLFALLQLKSDSDKLSRVIACNNIVNALFMVISAIVSALLLSLGLDVVDVFGLLAIINGLVALYIFSKVPEFFLRFCVWLLIHTVYRVRKEGLSTLPASGPAVLIANHVSFVDALIITACISRPVRFVMYYKIYQLPVVHQLFKIAKVIPIASQKENLSLYKSALKSVKEAINQGEIVCIFPEGEITRDGEMNRFKPGVLRIASESLVTVYPVALQGLWGSLFSYHKNRNILLKFKNIRSSIGLIVGQPFDAGSMTLTEMEKRVLTLRGNIR